MSIKHALPSLTALLTLEAAVRHKSFTRAAQELGVTQTAVSRQILTLEETLGATLFHRSHRAVEPTAQCYQLAMALNRHFKGIVESVREFGEAHTGGTITIGATTAFAQLWLLPRLVQFRSANPDVKIRLTVSDKPFDMEGGDEDVVIRYGVPPFPDGRVVASCGDLLYPVASPDYAQTLGPHAEAFWETDYDLISTESTVRTWYSWQDWFQKVGILQRPRPAALSFNHFPGTLYAARAGQGIALGWELLVQTFLDDGTLIRLGETCLVAEGMFHAVVSHRAPGGAAMDVLITWLTDAMETSRTAALRAIG